MKKTPLFLQRLEGDQWKNMRRVATDWEEEDAKELTQAEPDLYRLVDTHGTVVVWE